MVEPRHRTRSSILFALLMAMDALVFCQSTDLEQRASGVQLIGVLRHRTQWGPPGFGESKGKDSKQRIFVLELASPKTEAQLSPPFVEERRQLKIQEVQVRCGDTAPANCLAKLTNLVGKSIMLEGQIDYAVYPTDFLPLVMNVTSISEVERKRQNRR